jgi:hypothetical protein
VLPLCIVPVLPLCIMVCVVCNSCFSSLTIEDMRIILNQTHTSRVTQEWINFCSNFDRDGNTEVDPSEWVSGE